MFCIIHFSEGRLADITISVSSQGPLELKSGALPQGMGYNICAQRTSPVGASFTFNCSPGSIGRLVNDLQLHT